jgi:hypothetical protein
MLPIACIHVMLGVYSELWRYDTCMTTGSRMLSLLFLIMQHKPRLIPLTRCDPAAAAAVAHALINYNNDRF